jgi:hypothetical protein
MAAHYNWFPTSRDDQLTMARNWLAILNVKGGEWQVPAAETQALGAVTAEAESILALAKGETTRTPAVTAQCRDVFKRLKKRMQDIKRRYFYSPPLMDADFVSLGLKIPDPTHTPTGKPAAQVTLETFLTGRRELGVRIVYLTGNPADKANKGYRIWYKVAGPGETPPASPEDLTKSFYTMRKKDLIGFEYGDSGKTAYFAVQVENDGKKGPWCRIMPWSFWQAKNKTQTRKSGLRGVLWFPRLSHKHSTAPESKTDVMIYRALPSAF